MSHRCLNLTALPTAGWLTPLASYVLVAVVVALATPSLFAQTFTQITTGAIGDLSGPAGYTGASWVDFNGDGHLDLFVNNAFLFRNEGDGSFTQIATSFRVDLGLGNGNTWADYDNDGDLDVFICNTQSYLYRNNGNETFTPMAEETSDAIASRGWSCAWADIDNDGNVDLAITHPAGFVGTPLTNHLFMNDGPPDYTFTRVTTGAIVTGLAAYTVGTWSDYDLDGDMDYFVGAGPANGTPARDFLYRNRLVETGEATFVRITGGVIATDLQDGQLWNWIDYDNDGDLDAYLTNWGGTNGGMANRLYRKDGSDFTRVTSGAIVEDVDVSLSSVWGDFDNDGDLDCYVTNDGIQPDRYYQNNGDGTFARIDTMAVAQAQTRRGASAGDFDNDGDLDLLVVGPGEAFGFYRNDLNNGYNWLKVKTIGTASNRSGIGVKVRAKATIGGSVIWQMREVSSQNTFNGHNSLDVHFGLGDATIVDSLWLAWPSGTVDVYTQVDVNQMLVATEGQGVMPVANEEAPALPKAFALEQNYPNPFNPVTMIGYRLPQRVFVTLKVFDALGRVVATLVEGFKPAGQHHVRWDAANLASGVYLYRLEAGSVTQTRLMHLIE